MGRTCSIIITNIGYNRGGTHLCNTLGEGKVFGGSTQGVQLYLLGRVYIMGMFKMEGAQDGYIVAQLVGDCG